MPHRIKGRLRLKRLRIHRLLEFQRAFDLYLEGMADADYVKARAKKMLEVGLPRRLR